MRLLLAEDEKMLSDALVTMLTHNNYSVDAVYNGQDALDYLETGDYDGAILDIMMPKMDGLTVLRKIREEGLTLPVIMLTAKRRRSVVMRCTPVFQPDERSSLWTALRMLLMSASAERGALQCDSADVSGAVSAHFRLSAGLPLLPCMTGSGFTLHIARPDCIRGGPHSRSTRCWRSR